MSEPFKLTFERKPSGLLRADFKDEDGEDCVLKESNTKQGLWLGSLNEKRLYLSRDHARVLGFALLRFARTGSLAEPSPERQLANFNAAMDEFEEYDNLTAKVVTAARQFAKLNKAFTEKQADASREDKRELLHTLSAAEDGLCARVEALDAWVKQHGFEEESEGKGK